VLQGIYFDFGFVIGYPTVEMEQKYLYMDWSGVDRIVEDRKVGEHLRPGVGKAELADFFRRELYDVFVQHERTDLIDPQSGRLLAQRLPLIFDCPITPSLVNRILHHVNTMKYIEVDSRARGLLEELRAQGLHLSMISNMMLPGKLLIEKLRESAILQYFDTVTISSNIGFIKPHREIFLRTLRKDKLEPANTLFVGDTYSQDVLGARAVGMKTVWLHHVRRPSTLVDGPAPDYEMFDLMEIVQIVSNVGETPKHSS
jgi:HAD superfamily hydrolase (TIGR01549 family)